MTVTPKICVNDGKLMVHGKTILSEVPQNIVLSPAPASGAFVGATSSHTKSLHVFPMGLLQGHRFMCCFRFKLWWMTQRMGSCGKDVPLETQFMLIETKDDDDDDHHSSTLYTVLLPLLEGQFRAVLQGNHNNHLEICLESGDNTIETNQGHHLVYMHAGTNPFQLIHQSVKAVEKHLQTFLHREKKRLPSFLDWFGWCTWDAFYTDVTAQGVEEGLKSLSEGGTPPRFLIIDDGWQQIENKSKDADSVVQEGAQFASRLTGLKENTKFQKTGQNNNEQTSGLKLMVHQSKHRYNVKYVYIWHALAGYWGGVKPSASGMEHYETTLAYPVQSPGVLGNQPDLVMDSLSVHGLGLVHPKKVFDFYNELHAYLASCGVDGVKVDVQNIIETLGSGHGGRVSLTRCYHQALEASIGRNFPDNGCIACMCHNTDGIYSAKQTAVVRASDDFYPHDPASHTIHISSVAYNSLFLGEIMQPDWDMFHSLHPAAEYHAAARAIGGCAIYVSDKPGQHNFELLKKLVLPDGSVLRAQLPGRPTRDCLFVDPARDGTSLLKIWNMNKCNGVVGVFNCQGAGWCKIEKKTRIHDASPCTLSASVSASDLDHWEAHSIVYAYTSGDVIRVPKGASLPVTLKVMEYELFHFCPIKEIAGSVSFAAIGLMDMFNSGGAVEEVEIHKASSSIVVRVKGSGRFGVYCSHKPLKCMVGGTQTDFNYETQTGLMTFIIPVAAQDVYRCLVHIQV
ncbi:putative galactinol--sucrose galactosyltransferase 2 [Senna tora]|uniref:galactinol--sucrose galactosyltransferase n=1 Tax=Senna tora TaxID=362788 RepID=A0A834SGM3_9FABA|nr:putative galactinol--sucrose galactosyltransferase 2 [Senna tora]